MRKEILCQPFSAFLSKILAKRISDRNWIVIKADPVGEKARFSEKFKILMLLISWARLKAECLQNAN